jgi:Ca2+-binding RTX toxin-like protein
MAIINGDAGDNVLNGTDSADTIDGLGGNDTIHGAKGSDRLTGGDGNDIVFGDTGNDIVYEGAGNDTLEGGAADNPNERDTITYENAAAAVTVSLLLTTAQDTGGAGIDTIVNFEELNGSGFNDTLTGSLAHTLRGLAGNDVLTGGQTMYGGLGNDTITGGLSLQGEDGDDILDDARGSGVGQGGFMLGGTGNDTYYVDNLEDSVTELAGEGTDLIVTDLTTYALTMANVENLTGTSTAMLTFTGNLLANAITGNVGDDLLDGRDGNDTLSGNAGDDDLRGGIGDDTILGGDGDDIAAGGSGNDTLNGDAGDDKLDGGSGNDVLNGGAGFDVLTGGSGDDTITSAGGADSIDGGSGNDTLIGGGDADFLFGREGNDGLNGGLGADTMDGGLGDDAYYVDQAGDVVIESVDGGVDTVRAQVDYTLTANVEELFVGGAGRNGTGNDLANTIHGAAASNVLSGLSGDDTLRGADGRDTLDGGAGADLLDGGTGKDTLTGGADRDVFQFRDGDFGTTRGVADVITDFSQADAEKIQLNLVDADTTLSGDQAFVWIGNGAFTGIAGQLHYAQASGNTYVEGDTNGDGTADFVIALTGTIDLSAMDFVL